MQAVRGHTSMPKTHLQRLRSSDIKYQLSSPADVWQPHVAVSHVVVQLNLLQEGLGCTQAMLDSALAEALLQNNLDAGRLGLHVGNACIGLNGSLAATSLDAGTPGNSRA